MRIYGNEVISITENNLLNIERLKKTEIEFFNERGLLEMSNKNNNSLNFSNKVIDFSRLKSLGNKFLLILKLYILLKFSYDMYIKYIRSEKKETRL